MIDGNIYIDKEGVDYSKNSKFELTILYITIN